MSKYNGMPKRILDIICAGAGLALFSLPMIISFIAVKAEDGGPVIFKQTRMGEDMKPFTCYKVRTMSVSAPHYSSTRELDEPEKYITKVGAFLRKTSLDELPQLVNVLKGEMSIIGPRPVIINEKDFVSLRGELGIYSIKPGLTGLAQVLGRDCLTDRRKAALDLDYCEHISLMLDISLMINTVFTVLLRRNIKEGRQPDTNNG